MKLTKNLVEITPKMPNAVARLNFWKRFKKRLLKIFEKSSLRVGHVGHFGRVGVGAKTAFLLLKSPLFAIFCIFYHAL